MQDPLIRRLSIYSMIFFTFYLSISAYRVLMDQASSSANPSPFGVDYGVYHTAGYMVSNGMNPYIESEHHLLLEKTIGQSTPYYLAWLYPPTFLLFIFPFSTLPYLPALLMWQSCTLILLYFSLRQVVPMRSELSWIALGFPGILLNLRWGQNGFLSTALLCLGLMGMDRTPRRAGIALGFLSYKPQLLFFTMLIMLLTKRFKALFWTMASTCMMVMLSGLIFGTTLWMDYLGNMKELAISLNDDAWQFLAFIQPTSHAMFRLLGISGNPLGILDLSVGILVTVIVTQSIILITDISKRASLLILGTVLTTPYLLQYDLVLLVIPLVLTVYDFIENTATPWEWSILISLWILPFSSWIIVLTTHFQITPIILVFMMSMIIKRDIRRAYSSNITSS